MTRIRVTVRCHSAAAEKRRASHWGVESPPSVTPAFVGRTPRGSCNRTLLRRVLRSFFKGSAFLEGFLEGAL